MIDEYYVQLVKNAIKDEVRANIESLKFIAKYRDIELTWVIEEYRNQFNRETRMIA